MGVVKKDWIFYAEADRKRGDGSAPLALSLSNCKKIDPLRIHYEGLKAIFLDQKTPVFLHTPKKSRKGDCKIPGIFLTTPLYIHWKKIPHVVFMDDRL